MGSVSSGIVKTTGEYASSAVGGLGKLVNRMTTSMTNKPTPVESYVGMITKQDTKYATMA